VWRAEKQGSVFANLCSRSSSGLDYALDSLRDEGEDVGDIRLRSHAGSYVG
jgi:hypothetical protein